MRKMRWFVAAVMTGAVILSGCTRYNPAESSEQTSSEQTSSEIQTAEETTAKITDADSTQLQETEEEQEEDSRFFQKDGKDYQKVPDLVDGEYYWASVVDEGKTILDSHGHETVDHNTQTRWFKSLDQKRSLTVRRWDNLMYSAGNYLIYEYDGIIHVADSYDLYHPILSYDSKGTYGTIHRIENSYMVSNERTYVITFYDEDFQKINEVKGYRTGDQDTVGGYDYMPYFGEAGLMPVRDMETGLMGFMDISGELKIPCRYAAATPFANGFAAVLTDAEMIPYTEDGGTVAMFDAQGGYWGIIDTNGDFVIEPNEAYQNRRSSDGLNYYNGICRFTPVREDGTSDFIIRSGDKDQVLATVQVKK